MSNNSSESQTGLTDLFGPIISKYSRADALADGKLVDCSTTAREAGYLHHFAVAAEAWAVISTIPESTSWRDVEGRLWDVLFVGRSAIRRAPAGGSRVTFEVILSTRERRKVHVTFVLDLGPGDDADPSSLSDLRRTFNEPV